MMFILAGLVSVAFGVVPFSRPGVGAITLALLFGFYSLIYGVSRISLGVQLHQLGRSVQPPSLLPKAACERILGRGAPVGTDAR